ncbi:MAG: Uma2 family endonuclease [Fimbriimonas sp.]
MAAPAYRYVTLEEYELLERESDTKNEWFDGEIVAMSGAAVGHVLITHNVYDLFRDKLRNGPCRPFQGDMRVRAERLRAYPDVMIVCGEPRYDSDSPLATLMNPVVLVEVLSPSTEAFDRGEKFAEYRGIESLRDFVLVSQEHMLVEHYARQSDGRWVYSDLQLPTAELVLTGVETRLALGDIYEGVTFPSRPSAEEHPE